MAGKLTEWQQNIPTSSNIANPPKFTRIEIFGLATLAQSPNRRLKIDDALKKYKKSLSKNIKNINIKNRFF
jgi:hypothetical protein